MTPPKNRGEQIIVQGCTIVARNYLAQARVLARSFKEHHPDWPFAILVIDDPDNREPPTEGVDLLNLNDIGLDEGDAHRMPMIYNVTELSTAVKPWLLRQLLKAATGPVVYFDPDIEIFAPLHDVGRLAQEHSIVLTPHVTEPMPRDKLSLTESDILGSGIYNLGFIAIGPGSERFLDWWAVRLRRESVVDPARMRFTDQRWIDFVPGMYPHYILRDPSCNVAYWNLYSRKVVWTGTRYEVNGRPLRFFHFSGYDPDKPHLLSKHQGEHPRILLSEHPGVAKICREYSGKLCAEGFNEAKRARYRFDSLKNGIKIDWYIHRLYRDALLKFDEGEGPEPPSPFSAHGEEAFVRWLNEPIRALPPVVTRYMLAIHSGRPDLQQAFPEPLGKSAAAFCRWFLEDGQEEVHAHESLIPATVKSSGGNGAIDQGRARRAPPPSVTVVGYLRAELGVGEAARLLIAGLEAANVSYNTLTNRETISRQTHRVVERDEGNLGSDINIVCVNADQTPVFARKVTPSFFAGRHTIGVWFWEVEDVAPEFYSAINYVDEIWVASQFIHKAFAKISPKPVFKFHLPIVKPITDASLSRRDLGLPDRFTFLFSFDFLSVLERKNPAGVIKAFRRAFPPGAGPALLIKTINGDKRILDLEKLRFVAEDHPDITIRDGYVSAIEKNTLTAMCDCYVSLHRSEGYGLTMAEAMALGRPVIATGYSGNLEFMTEKNSYLCSSTFRRIGPDAPPYPATSRWADPDLDEAAFFMRQVYENQAEAQARGLRAADDIRLLHSPLVAGTAIRERIEMIRHARRASTVRDDFREGESDNTKMARQNLTRLLSRRAASLTAATAK
jgi:glycosyltransferase involved in cell wall biosynthesis